MSGKRLKSKEQINAERRRAAAAQAARASQGRRTAESQPQQPQAPRPRRPEERRRPEDRPQPSNRRRRPEDVPQRRERSGSRPPRPTNDGYGGSGGNGGRRPPANPDPNAPRRRRPRKRKKSRALRVLLIVLVILLVLGGALAAFGGFELSKINRLGASIFTKEDFDQDASGADTIEAVDWGEAHVATKVDGVVNILLVGQDTRGEQRQRSDSMIILSINKNTKQMTMVSIMRDLYVQIPGYSDNRINSAYAFGGFELLDATIEQNFGVVIDYNVEVNFNGFKDIVDKVGGIDVDLTEAEVEYMNSEKFAHTMNYKQKQNFKVGTNHLDGAQALCYARIRRVGDDFARTQRQRTIIQTVYQKAKEESWTKLLGIYESVADDLTTDMDALQLVSVAFSGYSMGLDSINSYRVPSDGSYVNETINRMMVLVPKDWNATRNELKAFLYGTPTDSTATQ